MNYNKAELCKDCKMPVVKRRDWHKSPVWEDEEIYDYLDELVESGKFPSEGSSSRMALARYLQRKYGMDRGQAKRILLAWSKIRRKDCKMPVEKSGEERQVADTIKRQIGMSTLMSLGAHKFQWMRIGGGIRGGIAFVIKYRSNQRGYVEIRLTAMDDYDIIMRDSKKRVVVTSNGVYADSLRRVLEDGFKKLRGER